MALVVVRHEAAGDAAFLLSFLRRGGGLGRRGPLLGGYARRRRGRHAEAHGVFRLGLCARAAARCVAPAPLEAAGELGGPLDDGTDAPRPLADAGLRGCDARRVPATCLDARAGADNGDVTPTTRRGSASGRATAESLPEEGPGDRNGRTSPSAGPDTRTGADPRRRGPTDPRPPESN